MDKAKLKELFSQLVNDIDHQEKNAEGFYDFEKECLQIFKTFENEVIEEFIGEKADNHRKKKLLKPYLDQ
jgi:hypothetical protein